MNRIRWLFEKFEKLWRHLNQLLEQKKSRQQYPEDSLGPLVDNPDDPEVKAIFREIKQLQKELTEIARKKTEKEKPPAGKKPQKNRLSGREGVTITLQEKLNAVNHFLQPDKTRKNLTMICLICYDITDNRLRKKIADYLEEKGCCRVQKSVFMAEFHRKHFQLIHESFNRLNNALGPSDSILMIPLSETEINRLKMIGRQLDMEWVLDREKVLLF